MGSCFAVRASASWWRNSSCGSSPSWPHGFTWMTAVSSRLMSWSSGWRTLRETTTARCTASPIRTPPAAIRCASASCESGAALRWGHTGWGTHGRSGLGAVASVLFNDREVLMTAKDEKTVRPVAPSQPGLESRVVPARKRAPTAPSPGRGERRAVPRAAGSSLGCRSRPKPPADIRCPKCRGRMRPYSRSGLLVEMCEDCRGMFLDQGELERLIDAEGGGWPGIIQPFDLVGEPMATGVASRTRARPVRARPAQ